MRSYLLNFTVTILTHTRLITDRNLIFPGSHVYSCLVYLQRELVCCPIFHCLNWLIGSSCLLSDDITARSDLTVEVVSLLDDLTVLSAGANPGDKRPLHAEIFMNILGGPCGQRNPSTTAYLGL